MFPLLKLLKWQQLSPNSPPFFELKISENNHQNLFIKSSKMLQINFGTFLFRSFQKQSENRQKNEPFTYPDGAWEQRVNNWVWVWKATAGRDWGWTFCGHRLSIKISTGVTSSSPISEQQKRRRKKLCKKCVSVKDILIKIILENVGNLPINRCPIVRWMLPDCMIIGCHFYLKTFDRLVPKHFENDFNINWKVIWFLWNNWWNWLANKFTIHIMNEMDMWKMKIIKTFDRTTFFEN